MEMPRTAAPRAGDVLVVGPAASVQFNPPILFRVIRPRLDLTTYVGWIWLDGYQLDELGAAVARREIFVQLAGLRRVTKDAGQRPRGTDTQPERRTPNGGPGHSAAKTRAASRT